MQISAYAHAARCLWDLALSAPPAERRDFPIWGTCLGFEQLAVLSADPGEDILVDCASEDQRSSLHVSPDWGESRLGRDMPEEVLEAITGPDKPIFNRLVGVGGWG